MPCDRHPDSHPGPLVAVVPIGKVPAVAATVVAAHIRGYLDLDADVTGAQDHPAYALDAARLQYDAARILSALASLERNTYQCILGLLDVDLFVPIFTHVFGEAQQGGRCAVVSMFRLGGGSEAGTVPQSIVLERTAKIALHEIGHLLRLHHCQDSHCLMHFSGDLDELDATPFRFCRYCQADLHQRPQRLQSRTVR